MKCQECNGKGKIALLTSVSSCKACGGIGDVPSIRIGNAEARLIQVDCKETAPGVWDREYTFEMSGLDA